jgi:nicotinate-nucleotide--dimethylbenzimidazole phosphoribosyltransferase
MTTEPLTAMLRDLPAPDEESRALVSARAAEILRPAGALARLDELAVWMAGWQRTRLPAVTRPVAIVFAADHGVAADGVSAYPADVTAAMLSAFRQGVSSINAMAAIAGARVVAVDCGVGRPTANFRHEPALDQTRFAEAVELGRAAVSDLDTDLLVVGEMGIGNTTTAAAVVACTLGGSADEWVGAGTGVDAEGRARKVAAVADAQARVGVVAHALDALAEVGGAELVALAAAVVEARRRSIPVVLDGYVATAAVLPLALAVPGALDHCVAGHVSAEAGHRRLLERLGLRPLLDLDMRLGEASGAMAAVPLLAMACRLVVDVPTFGEWFG